jgi:hypothetical protein
MLPRSLCATCCSTFNDDFTLADPSAFTLPTFPLSQQTAGAAYPSAYQPQGQVSSAHSAPQFISPGLLGGGSVVPSLVGGLLPPAPPATAVAAGAGSSVYSHGGSTYTSSDDTRYDAGSVLSHTLSQPQPQRHQLFSIAPPTNAARAAAAPAPVQQPKKAASSVGGGSDGGVPQRYKRTKTGCLCCRQRRVRCCETSVSPSTCPAWSVLADVPSRPPTASPTASAAAMQAASASGRRPRTRRRRASCPAARSRCPRAPSSAPAKRAASLAASAAEVSGVSAERARLPRRAYIAAPSARWLPSADPRVCALTQSTARSSGPRLLRPLLLSLRPTSRNTSPIVFTPSHPRRARQPRLPPPPSPLLRLSMLASASRRRRPGQPTSSTARPRRSALRPSRPAPRLRMASRSHRLLRPPRASSLPPPAPSNRPSRWTSMAASVR